jgi:hypothetical protein
LVQAAKQYYKNSILMTPESSFAGNSSARDTRRSALIRSPNEQKRSSK